MIKLEVKGFVEFVPGDKVYIKENGWMYVKGENFRRFYKDWKMHRDNGPAEICLIQGEECKTWYQNGEIHRDGAPAKIYEDGRMEYYQHGLWHREDGPAVIWDDDGSGLMWWEKTIDWYLEGELMGENEGPGNWEKLVSRYRAGKLLEV